MADFSQDFFTSRVNIDDGNTRIGQKGRLWYDSITNTIRISDGVTPGGIVVSANGGVGTQGLQGIQGIQGIQGTEGVQGLQGTEGSQGLIGTQGIQGIQGTEGAQGIQGIQGPQGLQGTQGIQGNIGQGITSGGSAGEILVKNSATDYDTGWTGDITTDSITTSNVKETVSTKTGATGTVVHDLETSNVFYHSSISGNFTVNFTNLNLSAGQGTNVSLILIQGATAYLPNAVQVSGVAQTINWQDSTAPTPNSNKKDLVTFSIVNIAGTYTVFGALASFGT